MPNSKKSEITPRESRRGDVRKLVSAMADSLADAMPAAVRDNADRFLRIALTQLHDPRLSACSPASVQNAVMEAAQLGLDLDGVLGHAYLVPYKGSAQMQVGYKGLVQLARRSGQVVKISAITVREGDVFEWLEGADDGIVHRPTLDSDRHHMPISWIYARARLVSGHVEHTEPWSWSRILEHAEQFSAAYRAKKKDSPWFSCPEVMGKKTMLIQLCKLLPISVEAQRLVARSEIIDSSVVSSTDVVPDNLRDLADSLASRFGPGEEEDTERSAEAAKNAGDSLVEEFSRAEAARLDDV